MIEKVFIINNKYHFDTFLNYFKNLNNKNFLIFFEDEVPIKSSLNKIKIDCLYRFNSKDNLFIKMKKINLIKNFIHKLNINLSIDCSIYLGSDKQLFNQIFLSIYEFKSVNLFDEGIGLYRERLLKFKLYDIIYYFFSNLFFGISVHYVQPIGSHPKVNNIYARRKELLQYRRNDINYIDLPYELNKKSKNNNKVILLLPYNEKLEISIKTMLIHFKSLVMIFIYHGLKVDIKPHPRDSNNYNKIFIDKKNINIINKEILSEKLNLQSYDWIINYRSSSILNLIFSNYKTDKILTISFDINHIKDNIYPNIFYYDKISEIKNYINNKI